MILAAKRGLVTDGKGSMGKVLVRSDLFGRHGYPDRLTIRPGLPDFLSTIGTGSRVQAKELRSGGVLINNGDAFLRLRSIRLVLGGVGAVAELETARSDWTAFAWSGR